MFLEPWHPRRSGATLAAPRGFAANSQEPCGLDLNNNLAFPEGFRIANIETPPFLF